MESMYDKKLVISLIRNRVNKWKEISKNHSEWNQWIEDLEEIVPSVIDQCSSFPGYEKVFKNYIDGLAINFWEDRKEQSEKLMRPAKGLVFHSDIQAVINKFQEDGSKDILIIISASYSQFE